MRANLVLFGRAAAVGALFVSGMTLATLTVTSRVGAAGSNASQVSLAPMAVRSLSGVKVFGWGFDDPDGVASDGIHVWVANQGGNSVTELSASTGALVRVDSGPRYGFDQVVSGIGGLIVLPGPSAIASDGTHVWVANSNGNSVTELSSSTGALVRVIRGSSYGFDYPEGIARNANHVWVVNSNGNSVTELSASTGALVWVISGSSYGFDDPVAVASDGSHVWVANVYGNSLTELSASTGALVRVISGSSYGFDDPVGVASKGSRVWVANSNGMTVTEFSAS